MRALLLCACLFAAFIGATCADPPDDDRPISSRPSSLSVLAGLPRPSFSLSGVSAELATYIRDAQQYQVYMDELSDELNAGGIGAYFSFATSGNPDDPRGYVQALIVWACVGVAWFVLAGTLAFCMCMGRGCCCGPACCGRRYPTVKGGAYSGRQKAVAYGFMALFVVATATFLGLAQGRGNAGLTEAQKRLARGVGYGAAANARATVSSTAGPLLEAYARSVVEFATDVNETAVEALPPADVLGAATCVGTMGGTARRASDELQAFVAASDAVAANPFCDATLDSFQDAAHRALGLQINVSCGVALKALLVRANATLAPVPDAMWDAVGQMEKGADVNKAESEADADVNATVAKAKAMKKNMAERFPGVDCCTAAAGSRDRTSCDGYWERDDSGAKAALASARVAADSARQTATSIANQIEEPSRSIADFAAKYANFTTSQLDAAIAPMLAPALAATVAGPGGVAAGLGAVAGALRALLDPWGIDTSVLRDEPTGDGGGDGGSDGGGGDAESTVARVRRVVAAVEDRGADGALEAHGPWYYLTRVLLAADVLKPGDGAAYPAAAALEAAAGGRTMLLFGSYDKAGGDVVEAYPDGALAPAGASVACVTDACINATVDYLNARVLPFGGDGGDDNGNGDGPLDGMGGIGGMGMGDGSGDSGGAFAGLESVLLDPEQRIDGVDRELLMLLPALLVVLLVLVGFFAAAIPALTAESWSPCRGPPEDAARRAARAGMRISVGCGSRLACCVGVGSLLLAPWAFLLAGAAPFPLLLAAGDACNSARPLLRERGAALAAESSFCGGGTGGGAGGTGNDATCRIGGVDLNLVPSQVWDVDVGGIIGGIVSGNCAAGSDGDRAVAGMWRAAGEAARAALRRPDGPIVEALDRIDGANAASGDAADADAVTVRPGLARIARRFADAVADATRDGVAAHGAPGAPGSCAALHAAFRAGWAPVCGAGGLVDAWYWAAAGTYLVAFALLCCGAPAGVMGYKRFAPAAATRAWQRRGLGGGALVDDRESPLYQDNPLRNDGARNRNVDLECGNGNVPAAAAVAPTAHPVQRRRSFRDRFFGGGGGGGGGGAASAPPAHEVELADRDRALAASRADAGAVAVPVAVGVDGGGAAHRGARATMMPGDYVLANNNDNLDDLTTAEEDTDAVPAFFHPNSGSAAASAPPADDDNRARAISVT